ANPGGVHSMVLAGNGKILATTGGDGVIRRWDLSEGKELPCGDGFAGPLASALGRDGQVAAVGDHVGRLQLWAAPFTGQPRTLRQRGPQVDELAFSPDGRRLFVAQADRCVGVWDLKSGMEILILRPPDRIKATSYVPPTKISVSPDAGRVACSVGKDAAWMW